MKLKEGVRIVGIKPEMAVAITVIDSIYRMHGQELVITSAVEGKHSKISRHYLGYAIDTRTFYFDQDALPDVQRDIQNALGDDFYIEHEGNHFHIQFNPKQLTTIEG